MIINTLTKKPEPIAVRQFYPGQITMYNVFKTHGWAFNWRQLLVDRKEVYGLYTHEKSELLGLIALEEKKDHLFIHNVETSPKTARRKMYKGIGRHLIAYACKKSVELGLKGNVLAESKTATIGFYEKLGAVRNGRSLYFIIDELTARKLIQSCYKNDYEIREAPDMYHLDEKTREKMIEQKLREFDDATFDEALVGANQPANGKEQKKEDVIEFRVQDIIKYCEEKKQDPSTLTDEEIEQFIIRRIPRSDKNKVKSGR
jgi:ribosomal protein S18 acetylase RimI-like enzyme